jgi:hypothetical protein
MRSPTKLQHHAITNKAAASCWVKAGLLLHARIQRHAREVVSMPHIAPAHVAACRRLCQQLCCSWWLSHHFSGHAQLWTLAVYILGDCTVQLLTDGVTHAEHAKCVGAYSIRLYCKHRMLLAAGGHNSQQLQQQHSRDRRCSGRGGKGAGRVQVEQFRAARLYEESSGSMSQCAWQG